ncbi:hypothetical protein HanIR_Chr14g0721431 [Helianthus annuus]|nr:hypothetical protein HanIR_Chr14g0721431 [Helianthus annuus]
MVPPFRQVASFWITVFLQISCVKYATVPESEICIYVYIFSGN